MLDENKNKHHHKVSLSQIIYLNGWLSIFVPRQSAAAQRNLMFPNSWFPVWAELTACFYQRRSGKDIDIPCPNMHDNWWGFAIKGEHNAKDRRRRIALCVFTSGVSSFKIEERLRCYDYKAFEGPLKEPKNLLKNP